MLMWLSALQFQASAKNIKALKQCTSHTLHSFPRNCRFMTLTTKRICMLICQADRSVADCRRPKLSSAWQGVPGRARGALMRTSQPKVPGHLRAMILRVLHRQRSQVVGA